MINQLLRNQFLFEELVKRDFKKRYKRTALGMGWSMLMPLLTLGVMYVVFVGFFGRNINHFPTYLFCGNVIFSWFNEASKQGMRCLSGNAGIFTKVNVPKYLFLFAKNMQALINFALTLVVFFVFCWMDDITFSISFLALIYPVVTLLVFHIGIGMILSALYVFFKDLDYLWGIFVQLLMYGSAIFYPVDRLSPAMQQLLAWNPVYKHIAYFRTVIIDGAVPNLTEHLVLMSWAVAMLVLGIAIYRRYNMKFLYYV